MKMNHNKFMNCVVIFIFLFGVLYFSLNSYFQNKMVYSLNITGVVEDIHIGTRDKSSVVLKFKNTDKFNKDFGFVKNADKNVIKKGDSIFKPMFSYQAQVFRKDATNEYKFIFKIKAR
ncbi:hypothetical protein NLM59_04410 [Weeksellaceae bacterium KMM 9724]|uniref:hypothetical protein n=1 Tax=Profundicola chukchiensis TaxID=2961959 RepID=UPI00243786E4|nr:hypothetical protein [Profundicola chukchiensis]MDG4950156.1 hypothetical protein [Profundicola chukchiensis]